MQPSEPRAHATGVRPLSGGGASRYGLNRVYCNGGGDLPLSEKRFGEARALPRGVLVKRFRQPVKNQLSILESFQELGWPAHNDNPLTGGDNVDARDRRHDTIRRLNNYVGRAIQFPSDGLSQAITWELRIPKALKKRLRSAPAAPKKRARSAPYQPQGDRRDRLCLRWAWSRLPRPRSRCRCQRERPYRPPRSLVAPVLRA